MGQKVNPHGIRVGVIKDWDSRWYADKKNYGDNLVEDYNLRVYLKKKLFQAGVEKIEGVFHKRKFPYWLFYQESY